MNWDSSTGNAGVDAPSAEEAFAAFLDVESKPLVGFLINKRIGLEDAQDIAQESQIRLMRYRGQPHGALKVLLYRIALNLARDLWRTRATGPDRSSVDATEGLFELATPEPGPDQRAVQQQELARIRMAIARLPDHCRRIYLLNRIEGMSYSQIARSTNVTVKAVEKQISKALTLLRKDLGESFFTGPGDTSQ